MNTRRSINHHLLGVSATLLLVACAVSPADPPLSSVPSIPEMVSARDEQPGSHCALGGVAVLSGHDNNRNGNLDLAEVTATRYICSGVPGVPGVPGTPGADGTDGTDGTDGADGALGAEGAPGAPGADGKSTLVTVHADPPGATCTAGGQVISWGLDANRDGLLDPAEIASSTYLCNGVAGASVSPPLVTLTSERPGAQCATGGQHVEVGVDANHDGRLQPGEFTGSGYVCNGADVTSLVLTKITFIPPPGPFPYRCPYGSNDVQAGIDASGDGALQKNEVVVEVVLCALQTATPIAPGANCPNGGTHYDYGLDTNQNGLLEASEIQTREDACVAPRVAAGDDHTCAILATGRVECWGSNDYGQLGNGTMTDSATPLGVPGLSGATAIASSGSRTCVVLTGGTVECWGVGGAGTPVTVDGLSGVTSVAVGAAHTCALLLNGTVVCWGQNDSGQLGNGTRITFSNLPVAVSGLSGVTTITAGSDHTCALLTDGTVRCWGQNLHYQLGTKTAPYGLTYSSTPVVTPGLSGVTGLAAGGNHTCALLTDGTAMCWGYDGTSQFLVPKAAPVPGLSGAAALAAGANYTCAVLTDGTVKCWGLNHDAQLGNGTTANSLVPVAVSGLSGVTTITAGSLHTCAVLSDGTMECWGDNRSGQLGNGIVTNTISSTPTVVTGLSSATTVAKGREFTCAVLVGGTVECWGNNDQGQLGDATTTNALTPVAVSGLSNVAAITLGYRHTCALLTNKTVECWGSLPEALMSSQSPVAIPNLSDVTAVAAGAKHTCAVATGGTVRCWGANSSGQLGNGTTADASVPVPVSGLSGATAVAAGGSHTCALLTDGAMKCWGYNYDGELGDNASSDSWTPVAVSGLGGVIAISAGNSHTCAVLTDGSAKCWGDNYYGELGNGTTTNSPTPVTVPDLSGVTAIAASLEYTCALLTDGTVKCWGLNPFGQLGNGTTTDSLTPVAVSDLSGATAISPGIGGHMCAVLSRGTVKCWGDNFEGQLGNGGYVVYLTPVAVKL